MPGHVAHVEIARTVLGALTNDQALTWRADPEVLNALFHGALDPDMGHFPGGDPLITDLAHYVKTAELARNLVRLASNDVELAYAWGWISHVIADTDLHPAINRACGLHCYGTATRPMTWAESASTHMRVELGLDTVRLIRDETLRRIRLHDVFDRSEVRFLSKAFRDTYGVDLDEHKLLRGHRAVSQAQRAFFSMGEAVGRKSMGMPIKLRDLPLNLVYFPIRWLSRLTPDSVVYAVTHPLPPPPWLDEELDAALTVLPTRFAGLLDGDLRDLPDVNLDTGTVDDPAEPYLPTVRTKQTLVQRLQGGIAPQG